MSRKPIGNSRVLLSLKENDNFLLGGAAVVSAMLRAALFLEARHGDSSKHLCSVLRSVGFGVQGPAFRVSGFRV